MNQHVLDNIINETSASEVHQWITKVQIILGNMDSQVLLIRTQNVDLDT